MMNNSLKSLCKVPPGTIIEGKWHKHRYTIIKELGYGANGIVYLAQFQNQKVALKMSDNGMSITSEVNVLKAFAKVQGSTLGPSLLDVDDWVRRNMKVSFYVMEYIKGPDLLQFIEKQGHVWTGVLILQLLKDLQSLHENGWVFGDLKPENLIVTSEPTRVRCIDVGGTTIQGRAIKEYTEFYDRGYWGLGSRKAEASYDLFAVGMIILNMAYPKRFNKTTGGMMQLTNMIRQKKELLAYEEVIKGALQGGFSSAKEMREAMVQKINQQTSSRQRQYKSQSVTRSTQAGHHSIMQKPNVTRKTYKKQRKLVGFIETVLIVLIISILYGIYIYGQLV
ncbi:serine/threonine-protein kinase [Cytobacillus spongiae]|uniref:protein kinase domain-containing protein n=1 Tax=Cytobacillus spongiae TaxID=2901381 RepID=UPI001F32863C|nr:serine/threonine-protein kinase [Cytobacillus spongiae]UII57793.1 serine/threonine-protein kinase [Cytobacillus spongiae]